MSNEEFGTAYGDLELVAGAFRGARSFKVDRLGRLGAKHQPHIWTPGENLAACLKTRDFDHYLAQVALGSGAGSAGSIYGIPQVSGGGGGSSAGSVVQGTPVWVTPNKYTWTTAGSNTSNTFTVAPQSPYSVTYDFPTDVLIEKAYELMKKDTDNAGHRAADLSCTCGFYAYFDDGQNTYFDYNAGDVLGVIEGYGQVTVGSRGFKAEKAKIVALLIEPDQSFRCRLVRRNYPDVAIFETKAAMLAEFALTPNDPPGPEDDPDFWTRSA